MRIERGVNKKRLTQKIVVIKYILIEKVRIEKFPPKKVKKYYNF